MNVENAKRALLAAMDSLDSGDSASALDYLTVATAEVVENVAPGRPLLFMTDDARRCVEAGTVDAPPTPEDLRRVENEQRSQVWRMR